jgi:6-phosphogluconolactonase (cycloisomerase 2 family)
MNAFLSRVSLLLLLAGGNAQAAIDAPDHIIYGNVTVFGAPATFGTVIDLRAHPGGQSLARYELGSDVSLGAQFALRIPMDTVDPRRDGYARPGDPVRIFVGPQLAAETSVGADGIAVRLDLDPQNMGTGPSVLVANASAFEGLSQPSLLNFPISMNTTSTDPVEVEWSTTDGSATGVSATGVSAMACGPNADYVIDEGTETVAPGSLNATISVTICGDAQVEPDETFTVNLTRVVNGVLAQTSVTGTILDDDDIPSISVDAARAPEPASGSAPMQFRARLSRSSPVEVRFNYATQNLEAMAGADYVPTVGSASFAPGAIEVFVTVPILADADSEAPERLGLQLSNPVQASLATTNVIGIIDDPSYKPVLEHEDEELGGPSAIPTLVQPSDIEISPEGTHAYVASESGDAVLQFTRNAAGDLGFVRQYTTASTGFGSARLDAARDIELSADGRFLYVAAQAANGVSVLARDTSTGDLSFVQAAFDAQVDPLAAGGTVRGLVGAGALALSPDGAHLYVTGSSGNSLAVFARDAGNGQLRFLEAEVDAQNDASDAGGSVAALDRPAGVVVSGDGRQVYVAARFGNALVVFNRESDGGSAQFGRLSYVTSHRDGQLGIEGLGGAFALVLSSDGKHLYVASESDDAVVLFDRAGDGSLTRRSQWTRGAAGLPGMDGAQAIALSLDGSELYVAGFADHSVTVFARALNGAAGQVAGALTPRQTIFDGDGEVNAMAGPVAFALSPDEAHVYVAANVDNAIVRFGRLAVTGELFGDGFE